MQLLLCDRNEDVVTGWRHQFAALPDVEVTRGDVFAEEADSLVVPGNSFGFLDHGLELQLCERYGLEIQDRLRAEIRERFAGEVLVGQVVVQELPGPYRRFLYAPVVRTLESAEGSICAFLAARGVFLALRDLEAAGTDAGRIVFPGLATGSSNLHPAVSARQLRYAYEVASGRRSPGDKNLSQLRRREKKLKTVPRTFPGQA